MLKLYADAFLIADFALCFFPDARHTPFAAITMPLAIITLPCSVAIIFFLLRRQFRLSAVDFLLLIRHLLFRRHTL